MYGDRHCHSDADGDGNCDVNSNRDGNCDSHGYGNRHSYRDGNCDCDQNSHCDTHSDFNAYGDADCGMFAAQDQRRLQGRRLAELLRSVIPEPRSVRQLGESQYLERMNLGGRRSRDWIRLPQPRGEPQRRWNRGDAEGAVQGDVLVRRGRGDR